jgi:hypothetical protein
VADGSSPPPQLEKAQTERAALEQRLEEQREYHLRQDAFAEKTLAAADALTRQEAMRAERSKADDKGLKIHSRDGSSQPLDHWLKTLVLAHGSHSARTLHGVCALFSLTVCVACALCVCCVCTAGGQPAPSRRDGDLPLRLSRAVVEQIQTDRHQRIEIAATLNPNPNPHPKPGRASVVLMRVL